MGKETAIRQAHCGAVLLGLLWVAQAPAECDPGSSIPCTLNSECSAQPCRYCDAGGSGQCGDCCEFQVEIACPSTCTWVAGSPGECRNISNQSCSGLSVSEVPTRYRGYLLLVFPLLLLAWNFLRKRRVV